MLSLRKYIFTVAAAAILALTTPAAQAQIDVRFGNEAADTLRLTQMLDEAATVRFTDPESRVAYFALQFEGVPYVAHTLEGEPETLTVYLDSLDCTTFVDVSLALAYTAGEHRTSWRDFVYNLRRMRYRGGEINGYPSRLHYNSDWAVDNIHRGNLRDATRDFPRYNEVSRTLDFMTTHRDSYPALADSANYARMKSIESGYRLHRLPYIKTIDLGSKAVRDSFRHGDVVGFVGNVKGLDTTHMGIIIRENASAEPYVLHASMSGGKVMRSAQPLAEFMKKNRQWIGVRVFRLAE